MTVIVVSTSNGNADRPHHWPVVESADGPRLSHERFARRGRRICDDDGTALVQREDDKAEAVETKRLAVYQGRRSR